MSRTVLGSALYPRVASLLNHSCDPNTAPVTLSRETGRPLRQVSVAGRRIEEGEEICHIYQV